MRSRPFHFNPRPSAEENVELHILILSKGKILNMITDIDNFLRERDSLWLMGSIYQNACLNYIYLYKFLLPKKCTYFTLIFYVEMTQRRRMNKEPNSSRGTVVRVDMP